MCGRFTQRVNPHDFAEAFEVLRGLDIADDWAPRYNVAPTQTVLCIRDSDQREFFTLKWGLNPSWAKDAKIGSSCINARTEIRYSLVEARPSLRFSS